MKITFKTELVHTLIFFTSKRKKIISLFGVEGFNFDNYSEYAFILKKKKKDGNKQMNKHKYEMMLVITEPA